MTKLFLGNIPHRFSEQEISNWMESFGFGVESVEIIRDRMTGSPRGFGFVLLKDHESIREAIQRLNGQSMGGRPITVNEAVPLKAPRSGPITDP